MDASPRLVAMGILSLAFIVLAAASLASASSTHYVYYAFRDDFNYADDAQASEHWLVFRERGATYKEVVWDPADGIVYLTTAESSATGGIMFKDLDLSTCKWWRVEFIAFVGNASITYADGMAFIFLHNDVLGFGGGNLGARNNGAEGYLIELDTYNNGETPSIPHMALAEADEPYTVHDYVFGEALSTLLNKWIYVRVEFNKTGDPYTGELTLIVWSSVDRLGKVPLGTPVINETIPVDLTPAYPYLGFTASTGYRYEAHALDWFRVAALAPAESVGGSIDLGGGAPLLYYVAGASILAALTAAALIRRRVEA